ncbi:MAG: RNA methyltransferase [Bacteroidota bacterium]
MGISTATIKVIRSLKLKKFRQIHGTFVVEGEKLVGELCRERRSDIEQIYALDTWSAPAGNWPITRISVKELERISNLKTPNQVVALVRQFEFPDKAPVFSPGLYLESIQDPGNLGTILRIADWFGIPQVHCSPDTVDAYNTKVIQASMGAIFRVDLIYTEINDLLKKYPDVQLWATTLNGQDIFEAPISGPALLAIGNESRGLSAPLISKAHGQIRIPGGGQAESLNAGVATGIIAALYRQQNRP